MNCAYNFLCAWFVSDVRQSHVFHTWSISFCKWLYAETGLCAIAGFERLKKIHAQRARLYAVYAQFVRSLDVEGAWYVRVLSVFRQCLCVRNWLLARTSLTNHLQNTHISLTTYTHNPRMVHLQSLTKIDWTSEIVSGLGLCAIVRGRFVLCQWL